MSRGVGPHGLNSRRGRGELTDGPRPDACWWSVQCLEGRAEGARAPNLERCTGAREADRQKSPAQPGRNVVTGAQMGRGAVGAGWVVLS
eukprot:COSAG02_NODE_1715_length_11211_cov_8.483801_4_plen_89_part_00